MVAGLKRWTVYSLWSLVWWVLASGAFVALTRSAVPSWSAWSDIYREALLVLAAPAVLIALTVVVLRRFPRISLWICRAAAVTYVYLLTGLAVFFGVWTLLYLPALIAIYFACAALCRDYALRPAVTYVALPFEWWKREWSKAAEAKRQFRKQDETTRRS